MFQNANRGKTWSWNTNGDLLTVVNGKWYHVLDPTFKIVCLKAWGKFLFIFISFFLSWQPLRIFLVYSIINLHVKIKIWQPYRKMQCLQLKSILFFQLALSNTWLVGKLSVNILVVDSIYNRKRQQKLRLLEKKAYVNFEFSKYTPLQNVWSGSKSVVTFGLNKILTHPC